MLRTAATFLIVLSFAAALRADVVYTRDGKIYQGQVTRTGDQVHVRMEMGTITLPAAEVKQIVQSPASPTSADAAAPPPPPAPESKSPLAVSGLCEPESLVFLFLREAAGAQGASAVRYRQQVEQWQTVSHDQRRKIGGDWLGPEDFVRRRKAFLQSLEEARDVLKEMDKVPGESDDAKLARQRLKVKACAKMLEAARGWPDPLLRKFLLGVAQYQGGFFSEADALFLQCTREAPRVAAFHQGRALALLGADRGIDALISAVAALKLRPESYDAVELVRSAMKAVPGQLIKSNTYLEARKLLDTYEPANRSTGGLSGGAKKGIPWLMPGKPWATRDDALPVPAYDRMIFRQAVGVPIAQSMLLVDEKIANNALELVVQIDGQTVVSARAQRQLGSSLGGRTPGPPLTAIRASDAVFSPLETGKDVKFSPGQSAVLYVTNLNAEMGPLVRHAPVKIDSVGDDGEAKVSASLLAGETAGAIVTSDGKLVGFLGGRTDPMGDYGGPETFLGLKALAAVLARYSRPTGTVTALGSYSLAKRTVEPIDARGKFFLVHAVFGETFK